MNFSRSQRNGLIVLFLLVIVSFSLPHILSYEKLPMNLNYKEFEEEINAFYQENSKEKVSSTELITPFFFNPNNFNKNEMLKMGLNTKQITQILNYREKGGRFKIKSDFAKIYAIDKNTYTKLKSYILLPEKANHKAKETKQIRESKTESVTVLINLNTLSVDSLKMVKGIGSVLSKRIIKYQNQLGGFCNKSQLLEVYGIKDEQYQKIEKQVFVSGKIKILKMNFASAGELSKHPYITAKEAKKIVIERSFNGPYKNMEDFIARNNMSIEDYNKLKAYISF